MRWGWEQITKKILKAWSEDMLPGRGISRQIFINVHCCQLYNDKVPSSKVDENKRWVREGGCNNMHICSKSCDDARSKECGVCEKD